MSVICLSKVKEFTFQSKAWGLSNSNANDTEFCLVAIKIKGCLVHVLDIYICLFQYFKLRQQKEKLTSEIHSWDYGTDAFPIIIQKCFWFI